MIKIIITLIIICIFFYVINKFLNKKINFYENFNNNDSVDKIPKIIIQTWKDDDIPEKYTEDIQAMKKYNDNYNFMFFNDNDIVKFLETHYPEYYESYKKLPIIIQKIDYFRYIAVYHYGGFYMDLDMRGMHSLDELLDYDCIFPVDQNIHEGMCHRTRFKNYCENGMDFMLGQYAFGAKPKNDFIKKLIDTIHHNIDFYISEYNKVKEDEAYFRANKNHYVYCTTGPDFVTDVYMSYENKKDIHILEYPMGQYFGKYAKHNYYGTWK